MGSIWDFGLPKGPGQDAKEPKSLPPRIGPRVYGGICVALALVIAAVLVMASFSSQGGSASVALLIASMMGPLLLAVIGIVLLRMGRK